MLTPAAAAWLDDASESSGADSRLEEFGAVDSGVGKEARSANELGSC